MNFSNYPILKILLSFILGIISGGSVIFPFFSAPLLLLCPVVFMLISIIIFSIGEYKWQWLAGLILNIAFFFAGFMMTFLRLNPEYSLGKKELLRTNHYWLVKIIDIPVEKTKSIRAISSIERTVNNENVKEKVLLYFKNDTAARHIQYGDLLLVNTKLTAIKQPKNPDSFDYRQFMSRKGVFYSGFVPKDGFVFLSHSSPNFIKKYSSRLQKTFAAQFARAGMVGDEYSIITAILLGNDDTMDPELKESYASTGVSHILSVSGMHVGIIYMILNFLLKPLEMNKRSKTLKALILLFFIWLYANITGLSPSVSRAAAMFTFVTFGNLMLRNTNIFHSLFASMFVLLAINPLLIFDIGFQLSYLALFGIVIFQKPILALWAPKFKIVRYFWELISVSFAAQLGTFPISIYYFGQFPNYFLLANMAVMLLSFVIVISGVVLLFVSFSSLLVSWVGILLIYEIKGMNYIIQTIEKLPFSVTSMIDYNIPQVLVLYVTILSLYLLFIKKRKKFFFLSLSFFSLFALIYVYDKVTCSKKEEIIVYSLNRGTAINFNHHGKSILLSDTITSKNTPQYQFAIENHERKSHINSQCLSFSQNGDFPEQQFYKADNFICFGKHSFYLLSRNQKLFPVGKKIRVEYLYLHGNPTIAPEKVMKSIHFEKVIIDESNSQYYENKWIEACQHHSIPFHSTRQSGFLQINALSK